MQQVMTLERPTHVAPYLQALPRYAVASRFQDDTEFYEMWPMRFESAKQAKAWIELNHPDSPRIGMEWVIVQVDANA